MKRHARTALVFAVAAAMLTAFVWRTRMRAESVAPARTVVSEPGGDSAPLVVDEVDRQESARAPVGTLEGDRGRVHLISMRRQDEFVLDKLPVEAPVLGVDGKEIRTITVRDGDPIPELAAGERLACYVTIPAIGSMASYDIGHWSPAPRDGHPEFDWNVKLRDCFDVHLADALWIPGTPSSALTIGTGNGCTAYNAVESRRYVLPSWRCDVRPVANLKREDGTALGYFELDLERGVQHVEHVNWMPVGSIHCELGTEEGDTPRRLQWFREGSRSSDDVIFPTEDSRILGWLDAGEWTVRLSAPGASTVEQKVCVFAGQVSRVVLNAVPAADRHVVDFRISTASGNPISSYIRAFLVDKDEPSVPIEVLWSAHEGEEGALHRQLTLSRGRRFELLVSTQPGIGFRVTPQVIGPEVEHVDVELRDGPDVFRPLVRLESDDGAPATEVWDLTIQSTRSAEVAWDMSTGEFGPVSPSDDVSIAFYSGEPEFDPLVISASALQSLKLAAGSEPVVIQVHSPARTVMLRFHDELGFGLPRLEARRDDGTVWHTDAWGFVSILAKAKAGSVTVPGYWFDLGDDGRCPVLELGQFAPGEMQSFTLVRAPESAR